jgi:hypothetical protein
MQRPGFGKLFGMTDLSGIMKHGTKLDDLRIASRAEPLKHRNQASRSFIDKLCMTNETI